MPSNLTVKETEKLCKQILRVNEPMLNYTQNQTFAVSTLPFSLSRQLQFILDSISTSLAPFLYRHLVPFSPGNLSFLIQRIVLLGIPRIDTQTIYPFISSFSTQTHVYYQDISFFLRTYDIASFPFRISALTQLIFSLSITLELCLTSHGLFHDVTASFSVEPCFSIDSLATPPLDIFSRICRLSLSDPDILFLPFLFHTLTLYLPSSKTSFYL